MMYKTVNFNIFEENLQDIVYGEKSACEKETKDKAEKKTEKTTQKLNEIIIKPLNNKRFEGEKDRI